MKKVGQDIPPTLMEMATVESSRPGVNADTVDAGLDVGSGVDSESERSNTEVRGTNARRDPGGRDGNAESEESPELAETKEWNGGDDCPLCGFEILAQRFSLRAVAPAAALNGRSIRGYRTESFRSLPACLCSMLETCW